MLSGSGYDKEAKFHLYLVRAKKIGKDKKRKTNIYIIRKDSSSAYAERLGLIQWSGRWRQYVFYPDNETMWSRGCLEIITEWLNDKNKRHRLKLKSHNSNSEPKGSTQNTG